MTSTIPAHVPPSKQRTSCSVCKRVLLRKTLRRHIHTHHHKEVTFRCKGCSKTFRRKDHLVRHCREKHSLDSDSVECVHCGRQVRSRYLYEHWKGQKCLRAQRLQSGTLQDVGAGSMVDPLIISGSLLWLVWWIRFDYLGWSQGPLCANASLIPKDLYRDAFELRAYALQCANRLLSQALITRPTKRLSVALIAQIITLFSVDDALFGEDSAECKTHRCSNVLKETPAGGSEFILQYEAIMEHSWHRADDRHDIGSAWHWTYGLIGVLHWRYVLYENGLTTTGNELTKLLFYGL